MLHFIQALMMHKLKAGSLIGEELPPVQDLNLLEQHSSEDQ
jgi:hypothetical protein